MNTALTAYLALKWSTLITLYGSKHKADFSIELPKLVEAQANLTAAALATMDKKLSEKVYVLLACQWSHVKSIETAYLEALVKLEVGNGIIVLASLLTKYLVNAKKSELVVKLKVNQYLVLYKHFINLTPGLSNKYLYFFYRQTL